MNTNHPSSERNTHRLLVNQKPASLARRAGVPLRCGGAFTSSKVSDFQAGQESADALTPALMSGANWIEKFILDANRLGMMACMLHGLALLSP